jgi:plastocyanin
LQDTFGNPIGGVTVSWAATGPVLLGGPSSITGADGRASMTVTAGSDTGAASVSATPAALADTLTFGLTVTLVPSLITVNSNFFTPDHDTIPAGGLVKWSWVGGPHNVTQSTGPTTFQSSADLNSGATFGPLVLTVPGTYTYHCTIHSGMNGTIVVQ